ncbi:MAG: 3-deoxy-D-manno-octulosonic acid transferase [Edaphobacter sp.]|uniref:3-deoxy-D-manno-octulosonic acid transferase n=1 Tax=Edaphobacter sp. TaxID=1934404 RepID=UPI00238771DD|nr:3-deoxy-D-manno-octulosonic acid transferase [Edaphobacter sp.]MDE1176131.1 3-deoxy-D-manno-octulosonic acid transferase [Edaphobacter sp.]
MILAVYSVLLAVALVIGAPWWLARMTTSGRYRAGLTQRLGRIPAEVREAVAGKQVIWLHAVSVGEVLATSELVRQLREALPGWVIAVSTTTETGQKLARERYTGSPVFYLPLDFASLVRRYLHLLRPNLLILMESELWPNLMNECARSGVPVAVVNAKISDRSLPRYMRLRRLWRPLLKNVSLFLAQSEENARRLVTIGALPERVLSPGNLKYDVKAPETSAMTILLSGSLSDGAKVLVAGSTLEGEEAMLLAAWPAVLEAVPDAVMVLAPRHTPRFDAVAALAESHGITPVRASRMKETSQKIAPGSVVLLDTIGDLASVYSLATAAFVGGSLVSWGGHNPLEPARFGVPVAVGPWTHNFREIVEAMRAEDAILIVEESRLPEELARMLRGEERDLGEHGRKVFEAQAGATARVAEALLALLDRSAA